MKSPLRYPGGKSKACKIIEEELLKHSDISKYNLLITPFFGGGSFELYLQNKYNFKIIANDKFTPLISFWRAVKNNNEELYNSIVEIKKDFTKEKFINFRKEIMNLTDSIKQASYYFAINRSSFSGSTLSGGFSNEAAEKRFTNNSIDLIKKLDLDRCEFSNLDVSDFLNNNKLQENYLLFLDPPYYLDKSNLYGFNGDMHERFDHKKLVKTLSEFNNWILCYNDCEYIRNLYKDYKIITTNWKYGMNKTKNSSEILIINFS